MHITELPPGWLGKIHAMHRGTQTASGEYYLYTDADVHFSPQALRRAVSLCHDEGLGHLTILPKMTGGTLPINAAIAAFATGFLNQLNLAAMGRENVMSAAGVGAFALVQTEAFHRTKGWTWLKMEVIDDLGLATMMVRQANSKRRVVTGGEDLALSWYPTLFDLIRGFDKNGFIGFANFSLFRVALMTLLFPLFPLAMILGSLSMILWLQGLTLVAFSTFLLLAILYSRRVSLPPIATMLFWLAFPVFAVIVRRSAIITLKNGGIYWRGTFYSLEELKKGKRVTI